MPRFAPVAGAGALPLIQCWARGRAGILLQVCCSPRLPAPASSSQLRDLPAAISYFTSICEEVSPRTSPTHRCL